MEPRFVQFDDEALVELEEYLGSRKVRERVTLDHLDGYLTAIAVGPELIMPGEWLAVIWNGDQPRFDHPEETNAVISAMIARHNQIIEQLRDEAFAPLFRKDGDGQVIPEGWAEGFLAAVRR